MNNRIAMIIVAGGLLFGTTGCSGMRDFLFGRGARCGLCRPLSSPILNSVAPAAPCGPSPVYAPVQSYPQAYAGNCTTCYAPSVDCGCGSEGIIHSGIASDPYLNPTGVVSSGMMDSGVVVGSPGIVPSGPVNDGNWTARRYDTDGNMIISEDPLPQGAYIQP